MSSLSSFDQARYKEALHALKNGDESAKTTIAFYKLTGCGGVDVDVDGAIALLKERVEEGDGEAMWIWGVCNEHGIGTEKDETLAEALYCFSGNLGVPLGDILSRNIKKGTDSFVVDDWSLL